MIQVSSRAPAWAHDRDPAAVPWDIREEVELWAREQGRHAKIVWNATLACYEILLDLMAGDPRLEGWQAGRLKQEPKESIFLHRQEEAGGPFVGVNIHELGASGVRNWLDEGNLLSGTGRYASLDVACKAADRHNEELKAMIEKTAVENARLNARDNKRMLFGNPLVSVPETLE